MIKDIRRTDDDDVVLVTGERYDVGKILDAMCGLIGDFATFGRAREWEEPYTLSTPKPPRPDDDPIVKLLKSSGQPFKLPYGGHTRRIIGLLVEKEREDYDAGGLLHTVFAPPFRFDLHPLGHDPLYANFGMCREAGLEGRWITIDGQPYETYDPAPILRVYRDLTVLPEGAKEPRLVDDLLMRRFQRKLLAEFLETQRHRGIDFDAPGGLVREPFAVRFPHAVFGAGLGDLRVAVLRAGGD